MPLQSTLDEKEERPYILYLIQIFALKGTTIIDSDDDIGAFLAR